MSTSPGVQTLSDPGACQDRSREDRDISKGGKKQRTGPKPSGAARPTSTHRLEDQDQQKLEEDQALDQQRASALQSGVGNASLLAMMNRQTASPAPTTETSVEFMEEGAALESEQDAELESEQAETQGHSALINGGPPELPDNNNPIWGNKEMGGEDDPPKPPKRGRSPRRRRRPPEPLPDDPPPSDSEAPRADVNDALQTTREAAPLERPEQLLGDEHHDALWGWLQDPGLAARSPLEPESLAGLGRNHPLSRCATAGHLLGQHSKTVAGRALGQLARPLPGPSSLSGVIARAAALATLGQAMTARETGTQAANRAVSLVLEDDALPQARCLAWELARSGRMWAPAIFDGCIRPPKEDPIDPTGSGVGPAGAALLTAALGIVAGPWSHQEVPPAPRAPAPASGDPDLAWLDAVLAGADATKAVPSVLTYTDLEPLIHGVRALVRSAAMLQVELAAAAISAWRVGGNRVRVQLRSVLRALWRELGIVARQAMARTQELEKRVGEPHEDLRPLVEQTDHALSQLSKRLIGLREDGLRALAQVLADATRPRQEGSP